MATDIQSKKSQSLAIVGGGITGLTAAYYALKNGQNPNDVTVYEAGARLGGKIQTGYMKDGRAVNMGAEFIDSDHTQLIEICNALGVPLKASTDEGHEFYQGKNGKPVSGAAFHAAFTPLHEQIMRDKAEVLAQPTGLLAQRINTMSMAEYMEDIRLRTPIDVHPNLLQKLMHFVRGDNNHVRPEISEMAMHAFASETGQPARNINALQFLHEASAEAGAFLASDCGYRVEGGTENIIKALEAHLKAKGVKFEQNAPVKKLAKTANGVELNFREGAAPVQADKVVLALPAYALGKLEGLDTLGMAPQAQQFINDTQYTKGFKFTIKLKPGQKPQDGAFFADGYQVWSANPDEVTFLVNSDSAKGEQSPSQVVNNCLQNYAQANGVGVDQYFDRSAGNIVFSNPGKAACYASPAPGKALQLEHLSQSLDGMANNGVAVAGTYLPLQTKNSIGLGFMECGVNSSARAIDRLVPVQKERAAWMQHILAPQQNVAREQVSASR